MSVVIISCAIVGFFIAFYLDAFIKFKLEQKEISFKTLNDEIREKKEQSGKQMTAQCGNDDEHIKLRKSKTKKDDLERQDETCDDSIISSE